LIDNKLHKLPQEMVYFLDQNWIQKPGLAAAKSGLFLIIELFNVLFWYASRRGVLFWDENKEKVKRP